MEKRWFVQYVRDMNDHSYIKNTKDEAINLAKTKTSRDSDGDGYSVWELVGTCEAPVPTDIAFIDTTAS